jgi:hypothetical protein
MCSGTLLGPEENLQKLGMAYQRRKSPSPIPMCSPENPMLLGRPLIPPTPLTQENLRFTRLSLGCTNREALAVQEPPQRLAWSVRPRQRRHQRHPPRALPAASCQSLRRRLETTHRGQTRKMGRDLGAVARRRATSHHEPSYLRGQEDHHRVRRLR